MTASQRSGPGPSARRVAVAGGGIIGLTTALTLADRGMAVTLYDPAPLGFGASWAAAGMLAPAYEAAGHDGHHPRLLEACFASKSLWRAFADRIGGAIDGGVRFVGSGSFALATSDSDLDRLARMAQALRAAGGEADRLSRGDLLRWEPGIGPDIREGLALTCDGQVDNRAVIQALITLVSAHRAITLKQAPLPLTEHAGTLTTPGHDSVVIAAGWQSPHLPVTSTTGNTTAPLSDFLPSLRAIKPVKGQMLAVTRPQSQGGATDSPRHTLRKDGLYIVPREDRTIIGATSEPGQATAEIQSQVIESLRAAAGHLVPALAKAPVKETWSGVRPGSPDHAPLIGESEVAGVWLACGHYRNGILLAPLTAQLVADGLDGTTTPLTGAFAGQRFLPAPV